MEASAFRRKHYLLHIALMAEKKDNVRKMLCSNFNNFNFTCNRCNCICNYIWESLNRNTPQTNYSWDNFKHVLLINDYQTSTHIVLTHTLLSLIWAYVPMCCDDTVDMRKNDKWTLIEIKNRNKWWIWPLFSIKLETRETQLIWILFYFIVRF